MPSLRPRRVFVDCIYLEDGKSKLSQNLIYYTPTDTASYSRWYKSALTPM
jgi:hypothetical protein